MRNKKDQIKRHDSLYPGSILESNLSESTAHSSWLSQQLLTYYKHKSKKLEKEFDELFEAIENIKSICDMSNQLQQELSLRNEEVAKLQQVISDMQIHLFKEKEENINLQAENDKLKIQNYENKKKINLLLKVNGTVETKFLHFIANSHQKNFIPSKLPPKLQKMKEIKQQEMMNQNGLNLNDEKDPQVLLLNNQLLASQLDQHIKISREQIDVFLKEREILKEERRIERQRLQKDVDVLTLKLKESQDLLCEKMEALVKSQQTYEKDKTLWLEERDINMRTIYTLKNRLGEDVSDIVFSSNSSEGCWRNFSNGENERLREKIMEKEKLANEYQKHISFLETEVCRLKERADTCRSVFKEKTEKMTAQVTYLKSKYDDLDRRRHLEAEGFRTDIRMLKERLKELEKKLIKTSNECQNNEQQQLLASARNTLNRAKQLEKELTYMKSKISALETNTENSFS